MPMPMYSLPLIGHATPQKGGSKTRVQLLGRLRLFSWAIADWSSCLTPLCKDGSYDGNFTGRGASSPQGKMFDEYIHYDDHLEWYHIMQVVDPAS